MDKEKRLYSQVLTKTWERKAPMFSVGLLESQQIQNQPEKCALGDLAGRYSFSPGVGKGTVLRCQCFSCQSQHESSVSGPKELQTLLVGGRSWKRGPGELE